HDLTHLLNIYGYWAVLLFVGIESTGIPFPGETILLVAAIAAGTTHQLSIAWVIVAAASGAILGDNLGFWAGREGGSRRLAPLRALYPLRGTSPETGPVLVPQARRESGLLRALRGSAAGLGRLSGRHQPHGLAAFPALQCRRRPRVSYALRPGRVLPRGHHSPPGRAARHRVPGAGCAPHHCGYPHRAPQRTAPGGRGPARPTGPLFRERETSRGGPFPPFLPRSPAAPCQPCEATGRKHAPHLGGKMSPAGG
ncbi:MAG TPA: hypothetical protein VF043_28520, partial [Ktedonobacteraceae bacterium]